ALGARRGGGGLDRCVEAPPGRPGSALPGRWSGGWVAGSDGAVGEGDLDGAGGQELDVPALEVDAVVVLAAEQDQVGQAGGAAVFPVVDVVAFAPVRGAVAAGEPAAPVPHHQ